MKLLLFVCSLLPVQAFVMPQPQTTDSLVRLPMAGRGGMGMTAAPKKKNGKKKGTGKGNGMGKEKSGSQTTFDVSAAMSRLEKRYDQLSLASAKQLAKDDEDPRWADEEKSEDIITAEYVVAARASTKQGVHDWVPIAQLCLARPESEYENGKEIVQAAISSYCRELCHLAAIGAPIFSTVARNDMQYSVESRDSFFKFVYDIVVEGGKDEDMTKADARKTLGLEDVESLDKSGIKQAYRKLSFELHPDRFKGTPGETEEAAERFGQVKLAYETLSSGVREEGASWYESLGGRARTELVAPVNLLPLAAAQEQMQLKKSEAALIGLDPNMIQTFVARNLRSE
jgi:hypothetical protein